MKATIILIAALIISANLFAQTGNTQKVKTQQKVSASLYCASLKDGKIVVLIDNKAMLNEDSLQNGWKINGEGTITKKDGTKTVLKDGQCIDKTGKITGKTKMEGYIPCNGLKNEKASVQ